MDATTTSVKPPMPKKCGHCLEPICEHASGWLDGLSADLAEARAEIAAKDARIAELEELLGFLAVPAASALKLSGLSEAGAPINAHVHWWTGTDTLRRLLAALAAAKGE